MSKVLEMKKTRRVAILCLMVILFSSTVAIKAATAVAYFPGGSSYCVLRLTTSSIFASNASTYDDEELFDPAVSLDGFARNSNGAKLGFVSAQGYGLCQDSTGSLCNVYSGTCDYYVNGNKVLTMNTTING